MPTRYKGDSHVIIIIPEYSPERNTESSLKTVHKCASIPAHLPAHTHACTHTHFPRCNRCNRATEPPFPRL